jgi:hypothetical protein
MPINLQEVATQLNNRQKMNRHFIEEKMRGQYRQKGKKKHPVISGEQIRKRTG